MKHVVPIGIMAMALLACSGTLIAVGEGSSPMAASNAFPTSATCSYPVDYYGWVAWDCFGTGSDLYTCGSTHRCSLEDYDMTLVRWDLNGQVIWNRNSEIYSEDIGESVWANSSCIFTFGYLWNYSGNYTNYTYSYDFLLIKWDTAGNKLWSRTWGGPGEEIGYSVWGDNNYVYTCGSTKSYGAGSYDLALIKWDPAGNIVWNRTWGGTHDDYGFDVWWDGNYLYTSGKSNSGSSSLDIALVKWNPNGTIVWNHTWGGAYEERGSAVAGNNVSLYTCGAAYTSGGWTDLVLVRWTDTGTVLWNRTWGGPYEDRAYKMWVDESYVYTCGWTQDDYNDELSLVLIKWDDTGTIVWNDTWDGAGLPLPLESLGSDCCWEGDTSFDIRGFAVWGTGTSIYTCGYISHYPPHYADVAVVKWISNGTFSWAETWGTTCDAPHCISPDPNTFMFLIILIAVIVTIGLVLGLTYRAGVSRQRPPRGGIPEQPLPRSMQQLPKPREVPAPPAQPSTEMARPSPAVSRPKFCFNCGAEHPLGADFCPYCGASLRDPQ